LNPLTNQIQSGFAIITTTANELLWNAGVKRMPVIFSMGRENDWLKVDRPLSKVLGMLNEYPSELMNAYPINETAFNSDVNDKTLLKPIGDKLQQIVSLQPVQPRQYWQSKAEKKNRLDVPFVWKR
jgi:putative SOS response-associated peptidase YedK